MDSLQSQPDIPATATSAPLSGASYCWEQVAPKLHQQPGSDTGTIADTSPLGLCLHAPQQFCDTLNDSAFDSRHLVDGLLREMQIRAQAYRQRKVPWLSWQLPHSLLDAADITELMYFMGRLFQLSTAQDRCFSVRFRDSDINPNRAALFKGLGFNGVEVYLTPEDRLSSNRLTSMMAISDDFHFDHFDLALANPAADLPRVILDHLDAGGQKPDRVILRNLQQSLPHEPDNYRARFPEFFQGMRDLGYRVLGNDCFVVPGSDLANAQNNHHLKLNAQGYNCQNVTDVAGLGPGNISSRRHSRSLNPEDLQQYLACDFAGQNDGTPAHNQCKLVIDQLLCYHQLDLKYFIDRYHLDLEPLLKDLWNPLQRDNCPPLFSVYQHQLTLTPEGILQLARLCQALIQHFCR